jgi:ATP-binding cassette subfamily F protein 3
MLFSPANLLLLDEPTNHLDVSSRATVERALQAYGGTLIVVSHDRVFMDRVTNRIIELDGGTAHTYPGTYGDYLEHKSRLLAEQSGMPDEPPARLTAAAPLTTKEERVRQRQERKAVARKRRALERRIESLENEIQRHEARLGELQQQMANPAVGADYARLFPLADEHTRLKQKHQEIVKEWEYLHEELASLQETESDG